MPGIRMSFIGSMFVAVTLLVVVAARSDAADTYRFTVDDAQRTTVVGEGPSLRQLVAEICGQAGVALQFDSVDEPFAIAARDERLDGVLKRLLERHNYVLTVRTGDDAQVRVTSVHVIAPRSATMPVAATTPPAGPAVASHSPPATAASPLVISKQQLDAMFGGDVTQRSAAVRELSETVRANPAQLAAFLRDDTAAMAQQLREYPKAAEILRQIAASPDVQPDVRAKLNALVEALN